MKKKIYAHFRVKDCGIGKGSLYHGGGVTVYGEWDKDNGNLRAIGAVCMPDDNYCYSRGRTIAEGRFQKYGNNKVDLPHSVNSPHQFTANNEEQVHNSLHDVCMVLADRVHRKLPATMAVVRYYRSTRRFDS